MVIVSCVLYLQIGIFDENGINVVDNSLAHIKMFGVHVVCSSIRFETVQ